MKRQMSSLMAVLFFLCLIGFGSCEKLDGTPPEVTLIGDAEMVVYKGDTFIDPGVTAIDDTDGDVTANVTVEGTVGTDLDHYDLLYKARDAAGNLNSVSRTVTVRYGNHQLAGTYSVTESTGFNSENYTATIVADSDDDITFVFGSTTAQNPLTVTGEIALHSFNSTRQYIDPYTLVVTDGGPITQFDGYITENLSGELELKLSYLRPINGTTTNCNATWTKQ